MQNAQILSLNIGEPAEMEWNGKSVRSSMLKTPVPGPLRVEREGIVGNVFANPTNHGTIDSILYAYGMDAIREYLALLNREEYEPGALGETLTLDRFDEREVGIGDVFQIGTVKAQASFPRVPCGKVNIRMRHPQGQQAMLDCGRSGVYLRVLEPGLIRLEDEVRLIEKAKVRFTIAEAYSRDPGKDGFSDDDVRRARENGAFPKQLLEYWSKKRGI